MEDMGAFRSGLELNALFYEKVIGPALAGIDHAAARLGSGSEVLGFDTERSTDHGWGPRLLVLVGEQHVDGALAKVEAALPEDFEGFPVRYGWDDIPVTHHVTVTTIGSWLVEQLGVDVTADLSATDWLVLPQQKLLEVTAGAVYHDDGAVMDRLRAALAWYPDDVWVWMLAAQWRRIAQEEAFVGRTAEVGDDLGSRLVTARLGRELMRLWFLVCRTYWPYTKWFGSAFGRLPGAASLGRALRSALQADDYQSREAALVEAYRIVARRHNELGVADAVDPEVRLYYGRPYRVLMADRFVEACLARVTSPELNRLPLVGSIDQVADATDLLQYPERVNRIRALYGS
ncbi:MAG TPA: DUF4037 domain-containing protein [Acidimicrobiales bacterium]|nr:DUF4037 domain-containing protein [Acidimicrobiales bacterium]